GTADRDDGGPQVVAGGALLLVVDLNVRVRLIEGGDLFGGDTRSVTATEPGDGHRTILGLRVGPARGKPARRGHATRTGEQLATIDRVVQQSRCLHGVTSLSFSAVPGPCPVTASPIPQVALRRASGSRTQA